MFALAYFTFIVAELVHWSGILAIIGKNAKNEQKTSSAKVSVSFSDFDRKNANSL